MEEAILGFLIGVACGIVVGVLLGQVRFLSEVLSPYIKAVNALPRIVLGALFVIILGLGMSSKVVLAAFLVFFVVFFNAFQGVREVDGNFVNNARILGASRHAGGPQRGHPVRDDLDHRVAARGVRVRGHRRDRRGGPGRAARPRACSSPTRRTTSTPTASSPG